MQMINHNHVMALAVAVAAPLILAHAGVTIQRANSTARMASAPREPFQFPLMPLSSLLCNRSFLFRCHNDHLQAKPKLTSQDLGVCISQRNISNMFLTYFFKHISYYYSFKITNFNTSNFSFNIFLSIHLKNMLLRLVCHIICSSCIYITYASAQLPHPTPTHSLFSVVSKVSYAMWLCVNVRNAMQPKHFEFHLYFGSIYSFYVCLLCA